jgi:hypothetical protein
MMHDDDDDPTPLHPFEGLGEDDGDGDGGEFAITDEEREWMKTAQGAAMLIDRELAKVEQYLRNCVAMADSIRADVGEERFREIGPVLARLS